MDKLVRLYQAVEEKMPIFTVQEEYSNLVRANGNGRVPIQRWYHCKEAFSVDLLEKLILYWKIPTNKIERILDPFLGIGTTLLSAQKLSRNARKYGQLKEAVGIEINPFLHFVASAKVNWCLYNQVSFTQLSEKILAAHELPRASIPKLTTLWREEVFKRDTVWQLLGYKSLIYSHADEVESQALLLGLASILERVSGVRKDGRALRIVKNKKVPPVKEALFEAWDKIYKDLQEAPAIYYPLPCKVLRGNGRELRGEEFSSESLGKFDLILCSPPYLNNIDYSEVYKIELWMLDFISSYDEFRELRLQTFRSHPSVRFKKGIYLYRNPYTSEFMDCLEALKNSLPHDENFRWRSRLFEEYFDDVYLSLKYQWNVLNPGGWAFWVVGNSLHGSAKNPDKMVLVASDLLTALLARSVGFTVRGVMIARTLRRRSHKPEANYFLRESIIALQKS